MPPAFPPSPSTSGDGRRRRALHVAAIALWGLVLLLFWLRVQGADAGPLTVLLAGAEGLAERRWAPLWVLAAYLLRPLLLVPITVVNLASGFALGLAPGLALAALGTLASATIGYAIGRQLGGARRAPAHAAPVTPADRIPAALRRHGFESVAAGGLMYLHADAVNLPAGMLRIPYPVFLAGIVVGNALTMTAAVLAGASVDGDLRDARVAVDAGALGIAAALFVLSVALAAWLRRRAAAR